MALWSKSIFAANFTNYKNRSRKFAWIRGKASWSRTCWTLLNHETLPKEHRDDVSHGVFFILFLSVSVSQWLGDCTTSGWLAHFCRELHELCPGQEQVEHFWTTETLPKDIGTMWVTEFFYSFFHLHPLQVRCQCLRVLSCPKGTVVRWLYNIRLTSTELHELSRIF